MGFRVSCLVWVSSLLTVSYFWFQRGLFLSLVGIIQFWTIFRSLKHLTREKNDVVLWFSRRLQKVKFFYFLYVSSTRLLEESESCVQDPKVVSILKCIRKTNLSSGTVENNIQCILAVCLCTSYRFYKTWKNLI